MNKEMNSLKKYQTWKLVEKPKNEKVLDLKWILRKTKMYIKQEEL